VIVIETISGMSRPLARAHSTAAMMPALAFSVSKIVSMRMKVDAAFHERVALLAIDVLQPVEVDLAKPGIVHVGRQRKRLVGRADRAGDEARRRPWRRIVRALRAMPAEAMLMSRPDARRRNRPG
jgi:hypothetical protein